MDKKLPEGFGIEELDEDDVEYTLPGTEPKGELPFEAELVDDYDPLGETEFADEKTGSADEEWASNDASTHDPVDLDDPDQLPKPVDDSDAEDEGDPAEEAEWDRATPEERDLLQSADKVPAEDYYGDGDDDEGDYEDAADYPA